MKAIGYTGENSLDQQDAFIEFEIPTPLPVGHDLLVRINAIAINPVDTKMRQRAKTRQDPPLILGWDAVGTVEAIGDQVTHYRVGDEVYYAGDVTRPGCYASHQLVDERLVGYKPRSLNWVQAAALPLTSITAWEALFERLGINPLTDRGKSILIINGAGGVGSIAIQLAKQVAGLEVVTTASRRESKDWCLNLGATHVINHRQNLVEQYKALGLPLPEYILCCHDTDPYFNSLAELIAPQGMICSIVDTREPQDLSLLKSKSAGFVWEFMFTRSMYKTDDMARQRDILNQVSELVDHNKIKTTLNNQCAEMSVDVIVNSHKQIEDGQTIGKIVIHGMKTT